MTPKPEKPMFAKLIYEHIRALNPPGRFLKKKGGEEIWEDIGEKKALDKTRQALREDADKILQEIENGVRKVETVSIHNAVRCAIRKNLRSVSNF